MDRYYDLVLALIPLALLGGGGALLLAGVHQSIAVSAAGTVAVGLIGHALFVNGPGTGPSNGGEQSAPERPASRGPTPRAD